MHGVRLVRALVCAHALPQMFVACACGIRHHLDIAAIPQLGERLTEDLKVPGLIPGFGITLLL